MRGIAVLACLIVLSSLSYAQHRDPLTPAEIDQLRDSAQEPDTRLKLYVAFARARLVALDTMRADPKVKDRAQKTHNGLEDFSSVYDELNDNLDSFLDREYDLRKTIKLIIEADTEFQAKLHALNSEAKTTPEELKEYDFALSTAIETVDASADDHRKALVEQEEAAKKKKLKKPDAPLDPKKSSFREEPWLPITCTRGRLQCA
jgi:septal ring factor EnvC (AmiA/AmiB activator)